MMKSVFKGLNASNRSAPIVVLTRCFGSVK